MVKELTLAESKEWEYRLLENIYVTFRKGNEKIFTIFFLVFKMYYIENYISVFEA